MRTHMVHCTYTVFLSLLERSISTHFNMCGGSQSSNSLRSSNAGGTFHCCWTSSLQNVMHNGETEVKVLQSTLCVCLKILIDYKDINVGCLQNLILKWLPIASGYVLCIIIGLILVSHIYTHLALVVGINNNRYIKLFLAFCRKKCGICSSCIGTLVAGMLSHSQHEWIVNLQRVDCRHHGSERTVHQYQGFNPNIICSTSKMIWQFGIVPNM